MNLLSWKIDFSQKDFPYVAWGDINIKMFPGNLSVEFLMLFDFLYSSILSDFLSTISAPSQWRNSHVNSFPVRAGKLQIRKIPASTFLILFFSINCHKVLARAASIPLCEEKNFPRARRAFQPMSQQPSCTASCEKRFFFNKILMFAAFSCFLIQKKN